MKKFILLIILIEGCSKPSKSPYIADIGQFFDRSLSLDSLTNVSSNFLEISFYDQKMSFLGFTEVKGVSVDNGLFYLVDLKRKTFLGRLKNSFYPYMNLRSYLYEDKLYFGNAAAFLNYHYYSLSTNSVFSISNERNDSLSELNGSSLKIKGDLFFFYGYPYGPGIINSRTSKAYKPCQGFVMSPEYAIFAEPLGETRNLMIDCLSHSQDSINCYCVDTALNTIWNKTVFYEEGNDGYFKAINGKNVYVLCYSNMIVGLEKTTGETLWKRKSNKTILNCFERNDTLFLFEKQPHSTTFDSIYLSTINIQSGEKMSPITFLGKDVKGLLAGYYSFNKKYIFISLQNELQVYDIITLRKVFSKIYEHPVFLETYQDNFDNSTYTIVEKRIFW